MGTFGSNLQNIRKNTGYSQKAFAKAIGTTQQRVSEWETDKVEPTLYSLLKIIAVLNCSFDDLTEGIKVDI